jgi:hypothetical protein
MAGFRNRRGFLKGAATVGLIGLSYLTAGYIGWSTHEMLSARAEILAVNPKKDEKHQLPKAYGLEDILNATQKLVNISTYEFEYKDVLGRGVKKEVELYFIGSAVGVYKNAEEKALYFLSCDHVTASPKEIIAFGLSSEKPENGFYRGTIKTEGSEQECFCGQIEARGLVLVKGVLKDKRLGLFRFANYGAEGNVESICVDEVKELADTEKDAEGKAFVYNDDITLLKVDENVDFNQYNVWEGGWADEKSVKPGQEIYAVGYPLDLSKQVTSGIITSEGNPQESYDDNFYFTSAQLNPGNSGGGVWRVSSTVVKGRNGRARAMPTLEFLGLGRLKFRADGISGVVKMDRIKDFLRKEGYAYIYKGK